MTTNRTGSTETMSAQTSKNSSASSTNGMAEKNLLDVCEILVRRAQQRGAAQVEVYGEGMTALSSSLEQGELKGAQSATHEAFGIRVFVGAAKNQQVGFASVNRRDPKALDEAIDDAIAIARANAGDAGNDLSDPLPIRPIGGLDDAATRACGVEDAVDLAKRMLAVAKEVDSRVSVDSGSASIQFGETAIANSRGLAVSDADSAVSYGLFGMAVDGDEVSGFDHAYDATRSHAYVDVEKIGKLFASRVLKLLKPRRGQAYKGPVLFSSEAFEEIFLSAVLGAVDGDTVLKGKSRFAEKRGALIASPNFTLVDDGTIPGAVGSAPFDREGRPHRRTVLVGGGMLHGFLYDTRAARRAGTLPTGHAQGSARGLPSIGTNNLVVTPGTLSEKDLLGQMGDGLYVHRFSGSVDDVSGDFSGVAKGSFLVRKGKVVAPVKETLIAGNAFALMKRIVAMGDVAHRSMTTWCPHVLVDGVQVTTGSDDG